VGIGNVPFVAWVPATNRDDDVCVCGGSRSYIITLVGTGHRRGGSHQSKRCTLDTYLLPPSVATVMDDVVQRRANSDDRLESTTVCARPAIYDLKRTFESGREGTLLRRLHRSVFQRSITAASNSLRNAWADGTMEIVACLARGCSVPRSSLSSFCLHPAGGGMFG
jgi:hypothetical protein